MVWPLTIWILQTGEPLHIDGENVRPMRAMNLSNSLVEAGHKVVLWSAAFNHQEKRHRSLTQQNIRVFDNLEIRLIPSCGYQRHIGFRRVIDHVHLAINLKKMLHQSNELPDVAFIGYPPIETSAVMVRWLSERGVPSLLDVKDQWPAIFLNAMPSFAKPLGHILLSPYFNLAKRTMKEATGISAMANGFLNWGLTFAGRVRSENDHVFPLTTRVENVAGEKLAEARLWWNAQEVLDDRRQRVCFVGSHSQAFDFMPVVEAARAIAGASNNCQFIICGDGERTPELKKMMNGLANVCFPGWIDRPKVIALAERCCAAIAPYLNTEDFRMSIPNKIIDSLSLGLPILSPLQGEVASLIADHGVGLRYGTDTGKSLHDCIMSLMHDKGFQQTMSKNARNLYKEKFSYDMVYGGLVKHLEKMARYHHDR